MAQQTKTPVSETAPYFRTGKGRKRHASWYCANSRRRIRTGEFDETSIR